MKRQRGLEPEDKHERRHTGLAGSIINRARRKLYALLVYALLNRCAQPSRACSGALRRGRRAALCPLNLTCRGSRDRLHRPLQRPGRRPE